MDARTEEYYAESCKWSEVEIEYVDASLMCKFP